MEEKPELIGVKAVFIDASKMKQIHLEKQRCTRKRLILPVLLIFAILVSAIVYYTVNQEITL